MDATPHWDGMNAATATVPKSVETIYISGRKPINVKLHSNFKSKTYLGDKLPSQVADEIVAFMAEYNVMSNNNITFLSRPMIDRLSKSGAYCAVIRITDEPNTPIVGSIFTLPVELYYRGYDVPTPDVKRMIPELRTVDCNGVNSVMIDSCYTSYLCVRPDCRKSGLAMALIRLVMNVGWPYNVRSGYYLCAQTHHRCHVKINSWYRPLNVAKTRLGGFQLPELPDNVKLRDRDLPLRLHYRTTVPKDYNYIRCNDSDVDTIKTLTGVWDSKYRIVHHNHNPAYIANFDVYWITKRESKIAMFTLIPLTIRIHGKKQNTEAYQLAYLSHDCNDDDLTSILMTVGFVALELGGSVLCGHMMGPLFDVDKYRDFHPLVTDGLNHMEFYNADFTPDISQINVPLL